MRTDGRPSGVAVASAAASGSGQIRGACLGEPAANVLARVRIEGVEPGVGHVRNLLAGASDTLRSWPPRRRSRSAPRSQDRARARSRSASAGRSRSRCRSTCRSLPPRRRTRRSPTSTATCSSTSQAASACATSATPSARRRGDPGAGGAVPPHRLHGRPLRALRRARRAARRARADRGPDARGVLQLGHRGGRERGQDRAPAHGPPRRDRVRGRVPRPHAALDDDDVEVAPVQDRNGARSRPRSTARRSRTRTAGRPQRRRSRGSSGCSRPHVPAEQIAAIVFEPQLGRGRLRPRAAGVRRSGLRALCDRHGIVLVADEVQTGFGRTGRMFAMEHFDVEPDLITVAKSIAAGPAALRRDRQGRDHGRAPRGRDRRHLHRQPRRPCRRARRPRRLRRGESRRPGQRRRRRDPRRACSPGRSAGRRSATCAASARCSRSSSSHDPATKDAGAGARRCRHRRRARSAG